MTQMNEESLEDYIMQFAEEHPSKLYLILDAVANVLYDYKQDSIADKLREMAIEMEGEQDDTSN